MILERSAKLTLLTILAATQYLEVDGRITVPNGDKHAIQTRAISSASEGNNLEPREEDVQRIQENIQRTLRSLITNSNPDVAQAASSILDNPFSLLNAITTTPHLMVLEEQRQTVAVLSQVLKQMRNVTRSGPVYNHLNKIPASALPLLKPLEIVTSFLGMNSGSDGLLSANSIMNMQLGLMEGKTIDIMSGGSKSEKPLSSRVADLINSYFNPLTFFRNIMPAF